MDRIEKLQKFLEASPEDSFLQHALAMEHIKRGNDRTAKELLSTLLAREPGYIGSYYHLGKALERLGELSEAVRTYKKGMEQAQKARDNHSYSELQHALEDAEDLLDTSVD